MRFCGKIFSFYWIFFIREHILLIVDFSRPYWLLKITSDLNFIKMRFCGKIFHLYLIFFIRAHIFTLRERELGIVFFLHGWWSFFVPEHVWEQEARALIGNDDSTSQSVAPSSTSEFTPQFNRRPVDKAVTLGDTVVFDVDATGTSKGIAFLKEAPLCHRNRIQRYICICRDKT